jgi:hypothetical protein
MGILPSLFVVFLNLTYIGLDITVFFICVRILLTWKRIAWLEPFDDAGKRLVDAVTNKIGCFWNRNLKKRLTQRSLLLVSLIILEFGRIILSYLARSV